MDADVGTAAEVREDVAPAVDVPVGLDGMADGADVVRERPTGRVGVACESSEPCTDELRGGLLLGGAAGQGTCDDGLLCVPSSCGGVNTGYPGGYCTKPCEDDLDCPQNTTCAFTLTPGLAPQPRCLARCFDNCRSGWACVDEYCLPDVAEGRVAAAERCAGALWVGCFDEPDEPAPAAFEPEVELPAQPWTHRAEWVKPDGDGGLVVRLGSDCFVDVSQSDPAGGALVCPELPEKSEPGVYRCVSLAYDRTAEPPTRFAVWSDTLGSHDEQMSYTPEAGQTFVARLDAGGAVVGEPVMVSAPEDISYGCPTTTAQAGGIVIVFPVWTGGRDARSAVLQVADGELQVAAPSAVLADEGRRARRAVLHTDGSGRPHVFYLGSQGDEAAFRMRRFDEDSATFEPSVSLTPPGTNPWVMPQWAAAVDPGGEWFAVAWSEPLRDEWGDPDIGLQADASAIFVAVRSAAGDSPYPTRVHHEPDCATNHKPGVAVEPNGRVHVIWETDRYGGPDGGQLLYVHSDDGTTWSEPAPVSVSRFECSLDYWSDHGRRLLALSGQRLWALWSTPRGDDTSLRPLAAWRALGD